MCLKNKTLVSALALLLAGSTAAINVAVAQAAGSDTAAAPPRTLPKVTVSADEQSYKADTGASLKTDAPLRDTPQSISIVTRKLMDDQSMQNIADVVRYVPGIGMAQGEGNRDTPVFRGSSSTADFYVDGVRDDIQYYRDLYNIEQVEALKGPNGMLFGRGGVGG